MPPIVGAASAAARTERAKEPRAEATARTPSAVTTAGTRVSASEPRPAMRPANTASPTTMSAKKFAALVTMKKATVRRATLGGRHAGLAKRPDAKGETAGAARRKK